MVRRVVLTAVGIVEGYAGGLVLVLVWVAEVVVDFTFDIMTYMK